MSYVVALSFCEEDTQGAAALHEALIGRNVSCYFYKRAPRAERLMFDHHALVYGAAMCRVYFLRPETFSRTYTRFELKCGEGKKINFLLTETGTLDCQVPHEFHYITDEEWSVLRAPASTCDRDAACDLILDAVRKR
ncbi:hypothetical protein [Bradyrhizobium sp. OK095]|uniref:hypothetical protein n=1 Tax=Bradyrhizobium sp. OK095 TaxID=1882760 RepID=UPI0008CBA975|nr:hypothetical protein [Bradyrhizobium sp. OK095]SEO22766.1 hypothetical protein SAMN05443254_12264 [Bradyrhizobium sp. OK095]